MTASRSASRIGGGFLSAALAVGALALSQGPALAAQVTVTLSPPVSLLGIGLACSPGTTRSSNGSFCVVQDSANATTGEQVAFANGTGGAHTITFSSGVGNFSPYSIVVPAGQNRSTSFSVADRVSYSIDGVYSSAVNVSGNPIAGPTPPPIPPPNGTGPSTTTHPGTIAGSGTSKPRVVAAGTPQAGPIAQGPQGSSALPPVDALASPTPDASTLPPLTVPTPTPRAKVIATSATSGLSRRTALYIAGAVLFAVVALTAGLVIGIRRWRRGGTDRPFHSTA